MLDPQVKQKIIKKYRTHEKDTGSTEVQVAILTEEIKGLTEHLKEHRHDFSSRRGLLRKVNQRRSLLNYLERDNVASHEVLVKKLKLKIAKKYRQLADEVIGEVTQEGTESVASVTEKKGKEEKKTK